MMKSRTDILRRQIALLVLAFFLAQLAGPAAEIASGGVSAHIGVAGAWANAEEIGPNIRTQVSSPDIAPQISTDVLPDGVINMVYHQQIYYSGSEPVTLTVSGDLPDGLLLSGDSITGTPTTEGTFAFDLIASNTAGSDTAAFVIQITATAVAPRITTAYLPGGMVGRYYSQRIAYTGTEPVTLATSGDLPDGLGLDTDATISGRPTKAGTYSFDLIATNTAGSNTATFTVQINDTSDAPRITTTSLPDGLIGTPYQQRISYTAGVAPVTFTASGDLPDGLTLSADGLIFGTPAAEGTFSFGAEAANAIGSDWVWFTIQITNTPVAPNITETRLPNGLIGTAYNRQISYTGTAPVTFALTTSGDIISGDLTSGDLPDGLVFRSDGTLSGTPTRAGTFAFYVTAANGVGSDTKEIIVEIKEISVPPRITTLSLPGGVIGTFYDQQISYTGTAPVRFDLVTSDDFISGDLTSRDLPDGLALSPYGTLSGTPTATGTFTFSVMASNEAGRSTATFTISITDTPVAPNITTTTLPNGVVGTPYVHQISYTGSALVTFDILSGDLPDGLVLSSDGTLSGTPTTAGVFAFEVTAMNVQGNDTAAFIMQITGAPTAPRITTTFLQDGLVGTAYRQQISSTGSTPITFDMTSGDLPGGLNLSQDGTLSGTPTTSGTFVFEVTATNAVGNDAAFFTISITDASVAPHITSTTLPDAILGTSYDRQIACTGTAPITFELTSGDLPDGIVLSPDGTLYGTPTKAGTFAFDVTTTNAAGNNMATVTIRILLSGEPEPELAGQLSALNTMIAADISVLPVPVELGTPITQIAEGGNTFAAKTKPDAALPEGFEPAGESFSLYLPLDGTNGDVLAFSYGVDLTRDAQFAGWANLSAAERIARLESVQRQVVYEYADGDTPFVTLVGNNGVLSWQRAVDARIVELTSRGFQFRYAVKDMPGVPSLQGDILLVPDGKTDGVLNDPMWVIKPQAETPPDDNGGGGGGGCAGFAAPLLLLALPLLRRSK